MTTKKTYTDNLRVLMSASNPIIVTKTREPHRVIDTIKETGQVINKTLVKRNPDKEVEQLPELVDIGIWDALTGWNILDRNELLAEKDDTDDITIKNQPTKDLLLALEQLNGDPKNPTTLKSGIYALYWPHNSFVDPLIRFALLNIAEAFIEEHKMLIIVMPESADIPIDLQDFVTYCDFDVPNEGERIEIIKEVFEPYNDKLSDEDATLISSSGAGMTSFELSNSVSRSILKLRHDKKEFDAEAVSKLVLISKTDMVRKSEVLEIMPAGTMADIGGLENLKEYIRVRKDCFSKEAKEFGVDTPKGIGLFGPPGTGKSAGAKAAASEFALPLIKFNISAVFGQYVGQSESRVRMALKMIKSMSLVFVLVDEIDKVFNIGQGGNDSGISMRVLGSILTEMQEGTDPVFWIMTGNRTQGLPPELLRRGRLDAIFSVTVPHHEERLEILKIHLRKRKQDPDAVSNLNLAVTASNNYVAAELESAVKDAIVEAYNTKESLTGEMIAKQFESMTPLSEAFAVDFEEMRSWADDNAIHASKPASLQEVANSTTNKIQKAGARKRKAVDV